ncbi:mediator of DNA damage checkpoint protein 1 isoform X1 [Brassica rapa]|uniref:mediator of DNA damage checkpoint protein 1 isoform X1 n=1 Tax=Brassica campestris TaxID=3711 RepID=UPI00142E43B9|nr:mediator of DNA damage checkpoint protein 1 isoform X1 [Brassica rapa]
MAPKRAPPPPMQSSLHRIEKETIVSYPKQHMFLLLNPRDEDDFTKTHLDVSLLSPNPLESFDLFAHNHSLFCSIQQVLKLYSEELPDMNYASNTRKQSTFLDRCVSKGKYCSLVLKSTLNGVSDEILAAITYQIVPADTQYAEIPLAAVTSTHQKKGFGKLVYEELMKRLHSVGIRIIYCWADKESEGFWVKQGFTTLAEVDQKGKAKRLHIKSNIRKALCFPGGSTLMLSHLKKEPSVNPVAGDSVKLGESFGESVYVDCLSTIRSPIDSTTTEKEQQKVISDQATTADSDFTPSLKRSWEEASLSSLQSKRIRANRNNDTKIAKEDLATSSKQSKDSSSFQVDSTKNHLPTICKRNNGENYRILLMDIGDENKRAWLTEVIRKLGGDVTMDGNMSTHIVTGKVRKTLNFCTALCSGAWIVSPSWLKESFRQSRFANETSHILHDEDYQLKYETDLKSTVLRAKARPNSLLKGYDVCVGPHVQLPVETSSAIIKSAGGNVIRGVDKVNDATKTIYIGCEEDTAEALRAAKKRVWTFSSEWLMKCVLTQQLELQVTQFVESL